MGLSQNSLVVLFLDKTPVLIRKMTFAGNSKALVQSIDYQKAIQGLGLTHAEFVDLCILLGCDYCDTIKGVGPKTALKLIREHSTIEKILQNIDRKKFAVPKSWVPNEKSQPDDENDSNHEDDDEEESTPNDEEIIPAYVQARSLFHNHEVLDNVELKWKPCDEEGLTKFLVDEMGFNPERVKSSIEKLQKACKANSKPQTRMDAFFQVKSTGGSSNSNKKRKEVTPPTTSSKKKAGAKRR